jgi:hypothetical protein
MLRNKKQMYKELCEYVGKNDSQALEDTHKEVEPENNSSDAVREAW